MPEGEDLHRHGLRSSNKKPQLTKALEQSREGDELVMRRWRSSTTFGGRINSKVSAQHFQFSYARPAGPSPLLSESSGFFTAHLASQDLGPHNQILTPAKTVTPIKFHRP
jgi:hypothetical protein